MKIAVYSRKSRLSETGESVRGQIEMCIDYAMQSFKACDGDITVYEDEGYSGKDARRPGFIQMLADADKGGFDVVICYKLDRISRNVSDFSSILERLGKNGVSFVSVTERFDTSTPIGRAMMYISSVFAQLERETTAERVRDNLRRLARTGRRLGGTAPLGYCLEKVEYSGEAGKKKMTRLAPVQEELSIVKLVFQKYIELDSINRLYYFLAESGVKTRRGGFFCRRSIRLTLENAAYVRADSRVCRYFQKLGCDIASDEYEFNGVNGLIVSGRHDQTVKGKNMRKLPGEWIVAVGEHEGVIDAGGWLMVQERLANNAVKAPRAGQGRLSLLNSLIICGQCGAGMSVTFKKSAAKKGGFNYYYRCRNKNDSKGELCGIANVNGKEADKAVLEALERLSQNFTKLNAAELEKLGNSLFDSDFGNFQNEERQRKEINAINTKISKLTELLCESEGNAAAKYIIEKIGRLDAEVSKIREEAVKRSANASGAPEEGFGEFAERLFTFPENIGAFGMETAKRYVRKLVESVVWNGSVLEVRLRAQPRL